MEIIRGRLISSALSEMSRKRDHVFKQMKVGSKVHYFSYKFIFRHSRLVVRYIFPKLKQVYACRQWRIQEFFVRSTTSQLASLHHLRWNESPSDPSWGEERNGNRLAPSQGCRADGREPQLQRLQSINRCASSVRSCIVMQQQNPGCWPPNSTQPPP